MRIAHHIITHDIYLVFWCTLLLPHVLHAKLDALSAQAVESELPGKGCAMCIAGTQPPRRLPELSVEVEGVGGMSH